MDRDDGGGGGGGRENSLITFAAVRGERAVDRGCHRADADRSG